MKRQVFQGCFAFFLLFTCFNKGFAQSSFLPTSISGLKLWITGDSCKLNSFLLIDTVYDLSGNGNHAFQNIDSRKPQTGSILLNNHKTIVFDGIDDYLNFTDITDIRTVFWIIKERTNTTPNYRPLLGHNSLYDFHRGADSAIWQAATNINVLNGVTKLNHTQVDGTTTRLNSKFYIISLSTAGNVTSNNISNDRNNPGRTWDGNLAELIIYNQVLTPSQVLQVENYLNDKYAPPVYLGTDRIFCSTPFTLKAKKDHFKSYLWQNGSTIDSMVVSGPGTYYVTTVDMFDRTTSDTVLVIQDSTNYSVSLGNDTAICSNSTISLTAGPSYYSYTWSNGSNTSTIQVNNASNFTVSVTDCMGNTSIDSIKVFVKNLPIFNFGNDSIICSNSNYKLDPGFLNSIPLTFNWHDNTHDSIHSVNSTGQYYLTVLDNIGCSYSDTVSLQIDASLNTISLGPDTNLCAGNAIYLKSGTQPGLTYLWNDNSTNDSLYINTSGQYSAIITNTNYCIAKDTINVTVIGQAPTASFINSIACKNNSISFTDNSTPPSGNTISSWFWNFGDGTTLADTSVIQNPFYTYADTGNYLINLSVTTNAGCKQLFVKNVHVAPKPVANFSNIMACQNDSAQFNNLSTTVTGYSPLSYSWNFGDPSSGAANTSTLTSPKHLFSQQINYSVKLIATNNAGCKDSLTKNILVKAQVKADFTYNTPCVKIPITFTDNSIVPLPDNLNTRLWTIGTSTSTGLSATKSFTASGIYPVTLKVTGFNGCISTITKQIDVKQSPIAQFTLSSICYKDTGTAIDQSIAQNGTLTSWNWKLNDVTFSTAPIATLSPLATTSYSVKLTVTNSFNCRDSITKAFTVYPLPAVDFTTSPAIYYYPNSPIAFAPTTTGGVLYNWNINNTSYSILSPTVTFPAAGTYTASLSIKNAFGCNNTKTKTLSVIDYLVDLAVLDVRTDKSSDQYITIQTDLGNMGSAAISQFEISYQIADAATVKETWQGNLNPGGFLTYTFNSKAIQENPDQIYITCVNLGLVNSIIDFNVNNNTLCAPSDLSEIKVYDPYPNPSDEKTTLSIILPADMEINLDIVDELGQDIFMNKTVSGKQGLNLVTIPTTDLSKAAYIVKITIGDKIFIKKILKSKR